jgi:dephospho-CoA kinase
MKVIGVTGMPGSGKSVVSREAEKLGMKVVRMGDVIRDEALLRNEEPGKVAVKIRQEHGKFVVAERCVDAVKKLSEKSQSNSPQLFLIEGIRSPWEVEIFKNNFSTFKIISVHSSPNTRFLRIKKRMRSDDYAESKEAVKRDQRELKFGIGDVIANSDLMVVNEGSIGKLKRNIRSMLKDELHNGS